MVRRWLPLVAFLAFGAGAIACASEELNPQPLPPGSSSGEEPTGPGKSPGENTGGGTSGANAGSSSGSTGSSSSSSGFSDPGDAGADATDAADVQ